MSSVMKLYIISDSQGRAQMMSDKIEHTVTHALCDKYKNTAVVQIHTCIMKYVHVTWDTYVLWVFQLLFCWSAECVVVLIFSAVGGRTSTVGWNAGNVTWLNFHCWQHAAADVYRRTFIECWDTVRWWQIDADRCRQWQTWAACNTECLCNTYWHLRRFIMSRGNIVSCHLLKPVTDHCVMR